MPFGDLNTVVVTGHYVYPDGTNTPVNAAGTVTFEFPAALGAILDPGSDLIVVPKTLQVVLDGTGRISVVLPATNDPDTAPTFTYKVTENIQQASGTRPRVYYIEVPFGVTTLDLADVTPVETFPNIYGYVLVADFNVLAGRVTALEAGGPGTGLVTSVNAKQGVVVLNAADVGADPAGSAGAAAAIANAKVAKSGDTMTAPLVLSGDPVSALQAAPKQYVDAHAAGFTIHTNVRLKSVAAQNVNLASGLANGQTLDGITIVTGDRILLADQTIGTQNGVYVAPASGAASRAADANTTAGLDKGAYFLVVAGNSQQGAWATQGTSPVIGTDPIIFGQVSGPTTISAGTGIDVVGTTISVEPAVLSDIAAKAPIDDPTFTTKTSSPVVRVTGIPGAAIAIRVVGGSNAKPITGTFVTGDVVVSPTGTGWICTTGGTFPGTPPVFVEIGATLTSFALGLAKSYTDQKFLATPEIISSNPAIISFAPPVGGQMVMNVSPLESVFPLIGRNTVDQVLNQSSTTLQPVTGLLVPLAANTVYMVDLYLWYKGSDTADLKIGWVLPSAGWAGNWSVNGLPVGLAAGVVEGTIRKQALGWALPAVGIVGAAGTGVGQTLSLQATGVLFNTSTAGNLQLWAAQNASEASDVTIVRHSVLRATPIG